MCLSRLSYLLSLSLLLFLGSCSSWGDDDDHWTSRIDKTEKQLRTEAYAAEKKGLHQASVNILEKLTTYYALSPRASEYEAKLVCAYYHIQDYEQAKLSGERYIKLYTRTPQLQDVLYCMGKSAYIQTENWIQSKLSMPVSRLDLSSYRPALFAFDHLLHQYPKSKYRKEVLRMVDTILPLILNYYYLQV